MRKKREFKKKLIILYLCVFIFFPPGIANEYVFAHLKSSVLRDVEELMENNQYYKAYNLADKFIDTKDPEIIAIKKKAEEKALYRQTRKIPAP